jgi:hypothetical protein
VFPTLHDLLGFGPPIGTHSTFVALGMMAAGIIFLIECRRRGIKDPRIPYLVLGAIAGAAVMARQGTTSIRRRTSRCSNSSRTETPPC